MRTHIDTQSDGVVGIGDVAKICDVPVHTIRYWEREFDSHLRPERTIGKQRRYSDQDIATIMEIKKLLWGQRFSIKGAKKILSSQFQERLAPLVGFIGSFGPATAGAPPRSFTTGLAAMTHSAA
jgi:DNA-binding transcriptional MerR regulator